LERYAGWWGDIPWLVGMLAVAGGDSCAGWWGHQPGKPVIQKAPIFRNVRYTKNHKKVYKGT